MKYGEMPPYKDMSGNYATTALMVDDLQRRGYDVEIEVIGEFHVRATLYRSGYRVTQANSSTEYHAVRAVYGKS